MNGSISGNLTVYPNSITFSCDPGFILRGSSVRKCQSNGTWDGYKTICEGTICKNSSGQSPSRLPDLLLALLSFHFFNFFFAMLIFVMFEM